MSARTIEKRLVWARTWRLDRDFRATSENAASIKAALDALRAKGLMTPATIVKEAEPEESVLHPAFTWDNAVAGPLYREEQARALTNSIKIVQIVRVGDREEMSEPVPVFVSVRSEPPSNERRYESVTVALDDERMRALVLRDALNALAAWRRRYGALEELAEVVAAADRALAEKADESGPVLEDGGDLDDC